MDKHQKLNETHEVKKTSFGFNNRVKFSTNQLLLFVAAFAIIGGALLVRSFAAGTTYFRGDYESGTLSGWHGPQCEANNALAACPSIEGDKVEVHSNIVRTGNYAGMFTTGANTNRERAQVYADQTQTHGYNGYDAWYAWSTYIAPGSVFGANTGWNNLVSFHNTGPSCPAPDHFTVNTTQGTWLLHWDSWGGPLNETTCSNPYRKGWNFQVLQSGRWYNFVAHIKWSDDPTIGYVNFYLDGNEILPLTHAATLYTGQGVYMKVGFDRGSSTGTTTIYNDNTVIASDYATAITAFPAGTWPSTPGGSSVVAPAPTVSINASPTSVTPGSSSTLGWSSSNATSCSASGGWTGSLATNGSKTVTPTATTTYTITCSGSGGQTTASTTITVGTSAGVTTLSNSLKQGATISGIYPWTVTTSGSVSAVEYWETDSTGSHKLATIGGTSGTYVFNFDTRLLSNGSYLFGVVEDSPDGSRYQDPNRVTATIQNSLTVTRGLSATYFNNISLSGTPAMTRTDPTINFTWGSGTSPGSGVNTTQYSVRWSGYIVANYSGTYSFKTNSDDGIRVWVNNQQIINNWTDHYPTVNSGTIALAAGQKYSLKVEYYNNNGGGVAQLQWLPPTPTLSTVPVTALSPQ